MSDTSAFVPLAAIAGFSIVAVYGVYKQRSLIVHPPSSKQSVDCLRASGEPCADDFVAGSEFFGKHSDYFTADVQLELYGLYKQATVGDCPILSEDIGKMGTKRNLMTNAWLRKNGISSTIAQREYVKLLDETHPLWRKETGCPIDPFLRDGDEEDEEERQYREKYRQVSTWTAGSVPSGVIGDRDDSDDSVGGMVCELASIGNLDAFSELYQRNSNIINVKDKEGMSPLHWAADRGHIEVVRFLLSHGADIDAQDNCGNTPLHIAAMSDQKEIVRLLLDARADLTIVNCEGESVRDVLKNEFPKLVFS
jgi:acyl-CoA-binding protein